MLAAVSIMVCFRGGSRREMVICAAVSGWVFYG